jgi:peptide/nickel transport system substrate-binding protein
LTSELVILQSKIVLADPHDCTDAKDTLTMMHAVFDTLVIRGAAGSVPGSVQGFVPGFVPGLALSWSCSEDARAWRFHLREGVVFHDGTPCDAGAVVQSLRRMARADKGYTLGSPGVWHQYLGDARIEAVAADIVAIDLGAPVADLLDILVQGFIVAPASLAALDAGEASAWVGSGPYRLVSHTETEVHAARVDTHFRGTPANATVCWRAVPRPQNRLELLVAGSATVANALDVQASESIDGTRITRHASLDPVAIIYLLNAASGPFADPLVRRAISLAVDREALIQTVLGGALNGAAQPLNGFISPVHFGAADDVMPFDPDRAMALLGQAGFAKGLTLRVDCPTSLPDEAEALTFALGEQLIAVGITLDVTRHEDREAYAHMVRRKEIGDMCVFDSSPLSTFRVLYEKIDARVAGAWWQGYHNTDVERLLDSARLETNDGARAALYRDIYRLLQADPPWLTLYNPTRVIGLRGHHPGYVLPQDGVLDVMGLPALGGPAITRPA